MADRWPTGSAELLQGPVKRGEAMLARRLRQRLLVGSRPRLAAAPYLQETPYALGARGDCLCCRSFGEGFLGCFFPSAGPLKHRL